MCFGRFDHEGVDGGCTFQLTSGVSFVHFRPLSWHIPKVRDMYVLFLIFWSNIVKKACTIYILNTKRGNEKTIFRAAAFISALKATKIPRTLWVCDRIRSGKRTLRFLHFFAFKPNFPFQTARFKSLWTSSQLSGPRLHLYLALCSCDWINKKAS